MRDMSRTFSLGRLMLGVTAFCVLCGLVANYPQQALQCAWIGGLVAPSIVVWFVLVQFSRQRVLLAAVAGLSALAGLFFAPADMGVGPKLSVWQEFLTSAVPAAIGALLLGGAVLADEFFPARKGP
jgi:hypothetical protein